MSSCLGFRRSRAEDREPLLPRYEDDTLLQRKLHQKLHTYQMLRALSNGFMPTNEQAIANLRTLLAADVLNPEGQDLSDSGRAMAHYAKQWLKQLIELLRHKNSEDQIQDFIWYLTKARISVDMEDIVQRASKSRTKADTAAVYKSIQTVGSLLLSNSDFRLFLTDLNTVGREVFRDTAFTLSEASRQAGEQLGPSKNQEEALLERGNDERLRASPSGLEEEAAAVTGVLVDSAAKVVQGAEESLAKKAKGPEGDTMLYRLKQSVTNLRDRRDYSDSVSTLSLLVKRYAMVYSRVLRDAVQVAEEDLERNSETDRALKNFWTLLRSFGDQSEWDELERRFGNVLEHGRADPQFDELVRQIGNAVQDMMTDPAFFDHAEERFQELRNKSKELVSGSSLREDVDGLLVTLQSTLRSILRDDDIMRLAGTTKLIAQILSPGHQYANGELIADCVQVFVPLIIQAVQYIPIPRLEIATPEIDLLLENLVLEPGRTVNNSSFLPYKLRVETYNDVEIRKARFGMSSSVQTFLRIRLDGISIRADEIGYWLRAHSGLLHLADEGIASFQLDERGIDVEIDVEVGKDAIDKILSLRAVRVHVHGLDYTLRRSKFTWFAWLFKPLLRPLIRKTVEFQIASAIVEGLQFANRELVYARERLRAARIASPDDLRTFIKAVAARLIPPKDPDLNIRVGIAQPGKGVFKGVYAPGSIVKLWNEEAAQAAQRVREHEQGGWKNDVFDVSAVSV